MSEQSTIHHVRKINVKGWFWLPFLGHWIKHVHRHVTGYVPRHVLKHVPDRHMPDYVLKHVPKHVLRHMPDKHLLDNMPGHMSRQVNGCCSDDLAAAHYRLAYAVPMVGLRPTTEPNQIFMGMTTD